MDSIFTSIPPASSHRFGRFYRVLRIAVPLSFIPAAFAASEPSLITGEKESFGYSWEQELQLGAEADQEISAKMGLYEDPTLRE